MTTANNGMLGVIRSARDTIVRFALNSQMLVSDATLGTRTVVVDTTRKFNQGDFIVIRNDDEGEIHEIELILDESTFTIKEDLVRTWTVAEMARVERTFGTGKENVQYIKRVYLGDPSVIPDFPCITITADSRDESWWTINSTRVKWNCTISCIFEDSSLETAYEGMMHLTQAIENALWANRWPILGTLVFRTITADIPSGSRIITVDDTTDILPGYKVVLEDQHSTMHREVARVIDGTTLELTQDTEGDLLASRSASFIVPSRWVMWSAPDGTQYNYIHKGTLMKASQISWFVEEEIVRFPQLTGPETL
jgi:hypothetical protein